VPDPTVATVGAKPEATRPARRQVFPPETGGMERFVADLVGAQRAAGTDASVLVHAGRSTTSAADPAWVMRCPVWFRLIFAPISQAFRSG